MPTEIHKIVSSQKANLHIHFHPSEKLIAVFQSQEYGKSQSMYQHFAVHKYHWFLEAEEVHSLLLGAAHLPRPRKGDTAAAQADE